VFDIFPIFEKKYCAPASKKEQHMATMDVDEDFPAVDAPVDKSATSSKEFDLENYIANYSGHTKIDRLIFIAEHRKDLELEAFKMSIDELKKTTNTTLYKNVTEKVGDRLGAAYRTDQSWIDSVDKRAAQQFEKLEQDLAGYKANLVKESIRV
jgi:COP9 signalosome complex subunit 1